MKKVHLYGIAIVTIIALVIGVTLLLQNPDTSVGKSSKRGHPTIWNDQILYEHTYNTMVQFGYLPNEVKYIINVCSTKNNPDWCIKLATHTSRHETKTGTKGVGRSHKNNLYGLKSCIESSAGKICDHKSYPNRMASFEDWVDRYNKFRYKNNCEEMVTKSNYTGTDPWPWINNCNWMQGNFAIH